MPYVVTINNEVVELNPDTGFIINDIQHPGSILHTWSAEELADIGISWVEPEPVEKTVEELCAEVDAERDRRNQSDFNYHFVDTLAINDHGEAIDAGVRAFQMSLSDQLNWNVLRGEALSAIISDQGNVIMPMRAEDNWNVQTTAQQTLAVLSAMTQRGSLLLFYGGMLKSQLRQAEDPSAIDIYAGWPA